MNAITEHWESMARPVVHAESLRCSSDSLPFGVHYWLVTSDNVIKCILCGYSESLHDGV